MNLIKKVINLSDFKDEQIRNNIHDFTSSLLDIAKRVCPENPYSLLADKFEDVSNWNKKDWEFLFKRPLSFKDIRDAQITFEKIAQSVRQLADDYEKLDEKFEEIADDMFATNSAYDVINQMKNKPKPIRLVYDKDINYYFIGDAYSYIHQDILEEAFYQGFYPDMLSSSEARDKVDNYEVLLFAFYPSENHRQDLEKSSDGYTRKYVYDFGTIYSHEMTPLEDYEIYNILGEPKKKETVLGT